MLFYRAAPSRIETSQNAERNYKISFNFYPASFSPVPLSGKTKKGIIKIIKTFLLAA
jgi:hypothetical protein